MDNTVLSKETIAAVKNRPDPELFDKRDLEIKPIIPDYVTDLVRERVKKMDDWLMCCLLELGYMGPRKQHEIHEFIVNNDIELEFKPNRKDRFSLYIIRCKSQNYESRMWSKEPTWDLYKYLVTFEVF